MEETSFDFIIVGAGLAGGILAHHLLLKNKRVVIVDSKERFSSSQVAAGLYNPITGRKMTKTWKANDLFPYLLDYYERFEKETNSRAFIQMPMFRPFKAIEEQNEWIGRSADNQYDLFLDQVSFRSRYDYVKDLHGGLHLKSTGFLLVERFLESLKNKLVGLGAVFINDTLDFDQLLVNEKQVTYHSSEAERIIFCDGTDAVNNPFFNWLPFKLVKGEILEIEAEIDNDVIINRGVFIIPIAENRFKVGSTYNNFEIDWTPSIDGKNQIESKLKELINVNYKIVNHYAGVRPATKDRKPFIGMHPKLKNVGIFNGLGAKGVSLSPYFANQFAQFLTGHSALNTEVNINRYFKLFEA